LHFRPCDLLDRPGTYRPQLKPDAVPSILKTYPAYLQPKPVNRRRVLQCRYDQPENGLPLPARPDHVYCSRSTPLLHASASATDHFFGDCSSQHQQQQQLHSSGIRTVNPANIRLRKKVKILQQQLRRKRSQIKDLKTLIQQLKTSGKIAQSDAAVLDENFSGMQLELFKNEQVNTKLKSPRYTAPIKEFALSLFYYSPRAYAFARQSLHLPHPSTVRSWSASVDCQPGFLCNVFQQLQLDAQQDFELIDCAMMFDSMSIRKQTVWDPTLNKYVGFVDYGLASVEPAEQLASEVLVILLVGLKKKWKCPVGYFLINKISSTVQCELVRTALIMSAEAGLRVWTVTCDGAAANIETLRLLGCKFGTTYDELDPSFEHPTQMYRCYAMLDVCHMLKLARNALADMTELQSCDGKIEWRYLTELARIQEDEG
jgi:DNA transposase THAP9